MKAFMVDENGDLTSEKRIIRVIVASGTELIYVRNGKVGDVVVKFGGTLVSPPLSLGHVEHIFGDIKRVLGYHRAQA